MIWDCVYKKEKRKKKERDGKEVGNEGDRAWEIYVPDTEAIRAAQLSAA